ncbi:MAG: divalent-cation tolerance protein CutA [Candidatus Electryonea clarkiae]|nr:divalent-cation tolerance protein CutA [Candidatus Electryonea clarkiae]MDP8287083.1 divalent-cation tolerance protein CutA [Candidatus Electryonea clarkiae]
MKTKTRVVLITVPVGEPAEEIAKTLVSERLAACVNHIEKIKSTYIWKGDLCRNNEGLLIVKTTADNVDALIKRVTEIHPYEVPEVIALGVEEGLESYLDWISSCVDHTL